MKILIIEDQSELRNAIRQSLEKESYIVEEAATFIQAMEKVASFDYDCILLDIMLPGGNGLDILKELKKTERDDNVIILSAKDSISDKVSGLELGADDYLAKPFHLSELTARVKSVLRRKSFSGKQFVTLGELDLDMEGRRALFGKTDLQLNRKEFDILCYLSLNQNRLVNKSALAEHVWGDFMDQADDFEFIYSQIKNLSAVEGSVQIQAVYGLGYKLIVQ
ncbi:response regulator transcription factor [Pedobacter psychrodurus]|uniref:response regulator transcription factor n=1 Tax=Pedobacter psychrodurus TaxID=2530456 RepID=UPI00293191C1|nr:response regulator transcription factor [Pedobacter psychrodurus]